MVSSGPSSLEMDANLDVTFKKIKQCQHEVTLSRRLLTNSYNVEEIEKLEAQARQKQSEINKIKKDNARIRKWIKKNEKDKQEISENGFYDQEVYRLKNEYREDKQKIRELYYDTLKKRKVNYLNNL